MLRSLGVAFFFLLFNFSLRRVRIMPRSPNPVRSNAIPGGHRLRSYGFSIRTSRRTVHLAYPWDAPRRPYGPHQQTTGSRTRQPFSPAKTIITAVMVITPREPVQTRDPWLEDGCSPAKRSGESVEVLDLSSKTVGENRVDVHLRFTHKPDLLLRLSNAVRPL